MDEGLLSGVETPAEAAQESNVDTLPAEPEGEGTPNETGVETEAEEAADDPEAGDQQPKGDPDKAWAKRMETEKAKIRSELEGELREHYQAELNQIQAQMQQEFKQAVDIGNREAARHGLKDWREYYQKADESYVPAYNQQIAQVASDLGVEPDALLKLIEGHPYVLEGRQLKDKLGKEAEAQAKQTKWKSEVDELFNAYPGVIKAEHITREIWDKRNQTGKSLLEVVAMDVLPKLLNEKDTALKVKEQNQKNTGTNPGSVKGTDAVPPNFFTEDQVKKMSQKEVDKNYPIIMDSMKKWYKKTS